MPPRLLSAYRIGTPLTWISAEKSSTRPGVIPIGQGYGCAAGDGSGRHRVGDCNRVRIDRVRIWQGMGDGGSRNCEGHGYRISVHGVRIWQGMPHGGSRDRVSHRHGIGVDGVRMLHGRGWNSVCDRHRVCANAPVGADYCGVRARRCRDRVNDGDRARVNGVVEGSDRVRDARLRYREPPPRPGSASTLCVCFTVGCGTA